MSRLLLESYRNDLIKMGLTDDLIELCLAERFPDKFDINKIVEELQEENDFIRDQMIEKGFQPFHGTLSNDNVYGEPDETREESPQATSEASEERAFTETVTEANQQTDSEY